MSQIREAMWVPRAPLFLFWELTSQPRFQFQSGTAVTARCQPGDCLDPVHFKINLHLNTLRTTSFFPPKCLASTSLI